MLYFTFVHEDNYKSFKDYIDSKEVYNELPESIDFNNLTFAVIDKDHSVFFYESRKDLISAVQEGESSGFKYILLEDLLKI